MILEFKISDAGFLDKENHGEGPGERVISPHLDGQVLAPREEFWVRIMLVFSFWVW